MPTAVDPDLSWPDHYAKYGFAIVPNLVDRTFCDEALAQIRRIIKNDLPLNEWTEANAPTLYRPYFEGGNTTDPVFDRLFHQPRLRAAIETLYAGPGHWNEARNYYLFLKAFNPDATPTLVPRGHIDFPNQPIPSLYRGFTFQVALADAEPFSGNLTVHPGTHAVVQKFLLDNPGAQFKTGEADLPQTEPFEFVPKAGDVLFMHHLIFHSGNGSHAAGRSPRVAIHAEAFRDAWLTEVDPSRPGLSPWERSLAQNGPVRTTPETEAINVQKRREYVETLKKQEAEAAAKASATS